MRTLRPQSPLEPPPGPPIDGTPDDDDPVEPPIEGWFAWLLQLTLLVATTAWATRLLRGDRDRLIAFSFALIAASLGAFAERVRRTPAAREARLWSYFAGIGGGVLGHLAQSAFAGAFAVGPDPLFRALLGAGAFGGLLGLLAGLIVQSVYISATSAWLLFPGRRRPE